MEHVHELRTELAADRWVVDHADDLARYATLRNELASRGRANVLCHRHTDIPEYLTADLGDRPTAPHERGIWDRAAVRIELFRVTYDIADPARALGDRPHCAPAAPTTKRSAISRWRRSSSRVSRPDGAAVPGHSDR